MKPTATAGKNDHFGPTMSDAAMHRGQAADLALREVDDAIGAIDQHEAHRDERRQRAEHDA